jgi:hypothetical protein
MSCDDLHDRLAAAADNEGTVEAPLLEHLEGCDACARMLRELRGVRRELELAAADLPSDPSFLARLRQRAEELGLLGEIEMMAWWRRWTLRLVPMTAAACLLLIAANALRETNAEATAFDDLEQGVLTAGSPLVLFGEGEMEPLLTVFDRGLVGGR